MKTEYLTIDGMRAWFDKASDPGCAERDFQRWLELRGLTYEKAKAIDARIAQEKSARKKI